MAIGQTNTNKIQINRDVNESTFTISDDKNVSIIIYYKYHPIIPNLVYITMIKLYIEPGITGHVFKLNGNLPFNPQFDTEILLFASDPNYRSTIVELKIFKGYSDDPDNVFLIDFRKDIQFVDSAGVHFYVSQPLVIPTLDKLED